MGKANELTFQNDMIRQLVANGWLLGKPENYNRELALYSEDVIGFVKDTQEVQWQKFCSLYPSNPEQKFLERVAVQLNKADGTMANHQAEAKATNESIKDKRRESDEAYQFIAKQASIYHEKLKNSEESLKEFRSANLGASPESAGTVNARILELQRTIEITRLQITEIKIQFKNVEAQISGEAVVSAHLTEEGQIQRRVSALQGELDALRMTYLDTYPDIIILIDQISALKSIETRKQGRTETLAAGTLNPLFQQLRSQRSKLLTQEVALNTRLKATINLLKDEKGRAIQINTVSAVLAQLTRGYDVNLDIYQKLLRQRETARVSMNIDIANQGMTLKVQERAHVPSRPVGVRLLHFMVIGLLLGLLIPFGLAYVLVMFDGKIRSIMHFQDIVQAPVLGSLSTYRGAASTKNIYMSVAGIVTVVAMVMFAYGYVGWLRLLT